MSTFSADWLIETFVWTGALIALVLVLRRPVSRHFGPQVAYALWSLPLLRLVLPPIELPASLAPAQASADAGAAPLMVLVSDAPATDAAMAAAAQTPQVGIAVIDVLLPLWLGGAAIFLAWRTRDYLRMRRDLLAGARPVGEAGRVRLVETPAVTSPVAFGINDKVVALPPLFMALHDIAARDLAIRHELEHHRGHDLVANFAAQPLLALHWFNPLAWWGWRAMKRDQEAACDARVVAGRERSERAAYARVIAGFATGPQLSLAAPMACPMLGEKSIIHRLRSLTMTEVSLRRRRAGLAAIATTALAALPLTASYTYAKAPERDDPAEGQAQLSHAGLIHDASIVSVDPDEAMYEDEMGEFEVSEEIFESNEELEDRFEEQIEADYEAQMAEMDAALEQMELALEERERISDGRERALEDRNAALEDHRQAMQEGRRAMEENRRAMKESRQAIRVAMRDVPSIQIRCDGDEIVQERKLANGRTVIMICNEAIDRAALDGMREGLAAIEADKSLSKSEQDLVTRQLRREIRQMENRTISVAPVATQVRIAFTLPPAPPPAPAPPPPPAPPAAQKGSGYSFTQSTLDHTLFDRIIAYQIASDWRA